MQFRGLLLVQHSSLCLKFASVMVADQTELKLYLWPKSGSPKVHRSQAVVTYKATGEIVSSGMKRGNTEHEALEAAFMDLFDKISPVLRALACEGCHGVRCTCSKTRERAANRVASVG